MGLLDTIWQANEKHNVSILESISCMSLIRVYNYNYQQEHCHRLSQEHSMSNASLLE